MDRFITTWQNMTAEQLVIALLIFAIIGLFGWIKILSSKYNSLNTLTARVCDEVYRLGGMRLIKQHRGGDYEPINPLFDKD